MSRSTLADANEKCYWLSYTEFAEGHRRRGVDSTPSTPWGSSLIRPSTPWAPRQLTSISGSTPSTAANAVRSEIWIAVTSYLLMVLVRKRLGIELDLCTLLQIPGVYVSARATTGGLDQHSRKCSCS